MRLDPRSSRGVACVPRLPGVLLLIACLLTAPGCSRGPQFADVQGTVTLNGRPLPDVEVVFLPDPEAGTLGPSSSGYTNERGRYQLGTNKGHRGAVIGTHRVCIRDLAALPVPRLPGEDGRPQPGPKPAPKPSRVPAKYGSSNQTPLRAVEVKPGDQTLDFEVGSDKKN